MRRIPMRMLRVLALKVQWASVRLRNRQSCGFFRPALLDVGDPGCNHRPLAFALVTAGLRMPQGVSQHFGQEKPSSKRWCAFALTNGS